MRAYRPSRFGRQSGDEDNLREQYRQTQLQLLRARVEKGVPLFEAEVPKPGQGQAHPAPAPLV